MKIILKWSFRAILALLLGIILLLAAVTWLTIPIDLTRFKAPIELEFLPLLGKKIHLAEVIAKKFSINLEQKANGEINWIHPRDDSPKEKRSREEKSSDPAEGNDFFSKLGCVFSRLALAGSCDPGHIGSNGLARGIFGQNSVDGQGGAAAWGGECLSLRCIGFHWKPEIKQDEILILSDPDFCRENICIVTGCHDLFKDRNQ